jgi:predicted nucleic acid-binding Zn ribbon protein
MEPLQSIAPSALAQMLRQGPLSQGKLEIAWRMAVGDAIARAATVSLEADGSVRVEPVDQRWADELRRSSRVILGRLQKLLGTKAVARLSFVKLASGGGHRPQEPHRA